MCVLRDKLRKSVLVAVSCTTINANGNLEFGEEPRLRCREAWALSRTSGRLLSRRKIALATGSPLVFNDRPVSWCTLFFFCAVAFFFFYEQHSPPYEREFFVEKKREADVFYSRILKPSDRKEKRSVSLSHRPSSPFHQMLTYKLFISRHRVAATTCKMS